MHHADSSISAVDQYRLAFVIGAPCRPWLQCVHLGVGKTQSLIFPGPDEPAYVAAAHLQQGLLAHLSLPEGHQSLLTHNFALDKEGTLQKSRFGLVQSLVCPMLKLLYPKLVIRKLPTCSRGCSRHGPHGRAGRGCALACIHRRQNMTRVSCALLTPALAQGGPHGRAGRSCALPCVHR
eukprot:scaffold152798_cov20-Tisochrysis_lutea.AAC.4